MIMLLLERIQKGGLDRTGHIVSPAGIVGARCNLCPYPQLDSKTGLPTINEKTDMEITNS